QPGLVVVQHHAGRAGVLDVHRLVVEGARATGDHHDLVGEVTGQRLARLLLTLCGQGERGATRGRGRRGPGGGGVGVGGVVRAGAEHVRGERRVVVGGHTDRGVAHPGRTGGPGP